MGVAVGIFLGESDEGCTMTSPVKNVAAIESSLVLTELYSCCRLIVGDVSCAVGEVHNVTFVSHQLDEGLEWILGGVNVVEDRLADLRERLVVPNCFDRSFGDVSSFVAKICMLRFW